jgi:TPR repeat protein
MKCILCRLIYGPDKVAALERWANAPWDQPNNGYSFLTHAPNQEALKEAYALWKTDPSKSFQAYLGLAEQGCIWSMRQVGKLLLRGEGIPADRASAEKWLQRAWEAGDQAAMLRLARYYLDQKRYSDAEALLTTPANKEYAPALFLLAWVFLKTGRKIEARTMFEKAASLGHRMAKGTLSKLCVQGKFGIHRIPYGYRLANELREAFESDTTAKNETVPLQTEAMPLLTTK